MNITPLQDARSPAMVISHERSGTHFTMNALARCFGYIADPRIDLDRTQVNINYYYPDMLAGVLLKIADMRPANIVKSHHEFEFFAEIVGPLTKAFQVVYVFRNPADALASFWRFLPTWNWVEGPTAATALEFATTAPMGRLMRYQYRQYGDMLDRWAAHVQGWLDAAARGANIHVVRYEDLADRYEETIARLGAALGLAPRRVERPSRGENVVIGGPRAFTPPREADNRLAINDLALSRYPELMARLGYGALDASAAPAAAMRA